MSLPKSMILCMVSCTIDVIEGIDTE